MHYLVYISFAFIGFQCFNVLLNFLFRQRISNTTKSYSGFISILIPARNEEKNIGLLLERLVTSKNNNFEILVYNDQSTDNTAQIVTRYSDLNSKVRLIQSGSLPPGWLGKNHACYQLAQQAKSDYYLFIDADVRLYGNIINDTVLFLHKHKLKLLSIFPIQIQKTFGEKVTVPIMNYILLSLLPLIFVRISPFKAHAAANGQFMLFEAKTYHKIQPHKLIKNSPVEDIAIARLFKKQKLKIACLTGENRVKCRMYASYSEALNGFSKNIFMFFGNQPLLAFVFWLCAMLGFIPVLYTAQFSSPLYFGIIILSQLLISVISKQNTIYTIVLLPLQLLFFLQVMFKSLVLRKKKIHLWKGRNIYS